MANLKEWLLEMADGQEIEGVVLGEMGWGDYNSELVPNYSVQPRCVVLSWEDAQQWVDYEFDDGYGAPSCNSVYAWTKEWVISVYQYDGSTSPFRIPRNPTAIMPDMPGV